MPRERLRFFLTLLFASVLLMTLQSRWGPFKPFRFLSYPLNLINESYTSANTSVHDTLRKYTLREERLREVESELLSAKLKEQKFDELLLENQRLKEALGLKKSLTGYVATARVISKGPGRWSNAYVIDKGIEDSVEKDMTVITAQGLLGKVQEASGSYSVVLLIDDARFSAGVRLQSARKEAVLSGAGLNRCVLKYVDTDTEVSRGERLVTSGLDGLFPPGIPAAFVTEVKTTEGTLFHRIEATPLVDTRRVEEVIIIKR
jgi:rod shape-determining protein MreC